MRGDGEWNLIGGEWRGAVSGHGFECALLAAPGGAPPRFPRSGPEDLEQARSAGSEGAPEWWALAPGERRRLLLGLLEELARGGRPSPLPSLEEVPGFEPPALAHERRAARRLGERLLAAEVPALDAPGVALVRARACESLGGLLELLLPALEQGLAAVLLSDPHLPQLALELARAWERSGLPPLALGLLHDDGESALRAALEQGGFELFALSGSVEELARLRPGLARAARGRVGASGSAPFGAGVHAGLGPRLRLRPICNRSRALGEEEPLAAAAESVARAAFGRSEAFSGQRAGQIARVLCPERHFSEFTACLLEALAELRSGEEPLPAFDPGLHAAVEERLELGLGDGATLIHGPALLPSTSRRSRRDATLEATVFTNAEPRMRLVRAARPLPVLCLLRCSGGAEGAVLARSVDELLAGAEAPEPPGGGG